jgi:phosphatidylglycerol:prolipoprotein diacylglycerol transferase
MAFIAFPNVSPIAFEIGPFAVRWYGLAYLTAFLAGWLILRVFDERWELGLGPDARMSTMLAAVFGVIAGGRLGYVLFYNLPQYLDHPLQVFALWDGGMSFHGGLAGILLAGVWVSRHYRVSFLRLCDIGAMAAPIGFFFGRLANFVNDELWGRVTTVPWGVVFPNAGHAPRHPSQIYEAVLEGLIIFIVMMVMQRRKRPDGFMTGWLLVLYGAFRIVVEFFREPDIQIGFLPGGVTMGQVLSIPVILLGIYVIWRAGHDRTAATPDEPDPARSTDEEGR